MSSDIVIKVEQVSKCYQIYNSPRDRLKQFILPKIKRSLRLPYKNYFNEFWALQDISFELKKGESLGIIGRNGSGKSTLLQLICGTLYPSTGNIFINGRVAALLELGSGFNPEFTGRENVYMNASILGATKEEIEDRFEDIVKFADIGPFIEQPVKTYSSGMFVRLAFSVAIHVEPDILVVDEALAVGDTAFVHKCMARIKRMIDGGVTLILVTHDVETVKRFCQKGLWLNEGIKQFLGPAGVTGDKYYSFLRIGNAASLSESQGDEINSLSPLLINLPLINVAGTIKLSDDRLFLEAPWEWGNTGGEYGRGRVGRSGQKAVFRFQGTEIELCFARGGDWGDPEIMLDGMLKPYTGFGEWGGAKDVHVSKLRFSTVPGTHEVRILIKNNHPVWWFGGRTKDDAVAYCFRTDPKFLNGDPGGCGRAGNGRGRIVAADLVDELTEQPLPAVKFRDRFKIRVWAESIVSPAPGRIGVGVHIKDKNQNWIYGTTNWDARVQADPNANRWLMTFGFENDLAPGDYGVLLSLAEAADSLDEAVHMDVIETALVFRSVWTSEHPAVHGIVHVDSLVKVISVANYDSNEKV